MNSEQIAEIRARCDAATPGPWQRSYYVDKHKGISDAEKASRIKDEHMIVRGPGIVGDGYCNPVLGFSYAHDADIEFIAYARQAVPDLLDALEAETARANEQEVLGNINWDILVAIRNDRDHWKARAEALEKEGDS